MAYAFKGTCDSHLRSVTGIEALAAYSDADAAHVVRFTVEEGDVAVDELDADALRRWVDGRDPASGEIRGRELTSPQSDLILDGTINAPKSYSIAALIHPELALEFEALQDRLRDRIITLWQSELNARRGAGGRVREPLHRVEVVELRHRRSRALDPHIHRHLWLNVKVLGDDGKWSNVDSRVAMRLHTVVNAEGELAARTDPEWRAALARHGYTVNSDGEIAELARAVRPLSRRSNQIEANRARCVITWREEHPGEEPDHEVLQQIDRRAWAMGRPNKPGVVDEAEWEQLIRDELQAVDRRILDDGLAVQVVAVPIDGVDRDLLAARAIVDADERSTGSGGRFSHYDMRAGAVRAVAASGVVASRDRLQELIDDVVARTHHLTVDLLDGEDDRPHHVKGFMAASTASLKAELARSFDGLTQAGTAVDAAEIGRVASIVLGSKIALDDRQSDAAAAIAGTDRLVSVTGPAGAGKTTMLRVARAALAADRRALVVVAPTKKAASVASREIGVRASSLHALLADHGWRWARDGAGAQVWAQLPRGAADPWTGRPYAGPARFLLEPGDRVVVDEAGMIDLDTANALATVAAQTGAGIAMVGDYLQAMPVGHAGAMACLTRRATAVVELTSVHRFHDPGYAELTLRMREPASRDDALAVAAALADRGLIHAVVDGDQARDVMVEAYFRWANQGKRVALVTGTNEEADAINERVQERRLDLGQLTQTRIAIGQDEQRLLEGDVVQTRLNDGQFDVENRALWTIRHIRPDGIELASITDSGDARRVSLEYAAGHIHLAYASTVHGIQGETTDASVVGPGVDASGLYVGMTRGRTRNEAITIARTPNAARDQLADCMMRGASEVTIDDSVRAARAELARAARPPVPRDQSSTRKDHRASPSSGAESEIDRVVAIREHEALSLVRLIDERHEWMRATDAAICRAATRRHRNDAQGHGRQRPDESDSHHDLAIVRELEERRGVVSAECARLDADYADAIRALDESRTERAWRAAHPGDLLHRSGDRVQRVDGTRAETGSAAPESGVTITR